MFNIYASSTNKGVSRLTTFPGLSLGEVRGFLLDLCIRDIKKNSLQSLSQNFTSEIDVPLNNDLDTEKASKVVEDIIYDKMNTHQILTTVWKFSDKTVIIIKGR